MGSAPPRPPRARRAYNRLAGIARAPVLLLAQDDQSFASKDCEWMLRLLALYKGHPRLGAVGHKSWCFSLAEGGVCMSNRWAALAAAAPACCGLLGCPQPLTDAPTH
jgi:hypothetical protein